MESISWQDAVDFCEALTAQEFAAIPWGYEYRLPTEAEWEYCCRAGSDAVYCYGNNAAALYQYGNFRDAGSYLPDGEQPWSELTGKEDDNGVKTVVAKTYQPNNWRLFDMHGNVSEWCLDAYAEQPASEGEDPLRPYNARARQAPMVIRGGSWADAAGFCQSSSRSSADIKA